MPFTPTTKQAEATTIMAGLAVWVMLFGGGRSGKTFITVRNIVARALKAPGSRHMIVRFRYNHVKSSIILDTFPKVMRICFPELVKDTDWKMNLSDGYATLPGGSEIWFGGLDDGPRMEKILGMEFCTIYANEASQIAWAGVQMLLTRLAQRVMQKIPGREDVPLRLRFLFDCNPPSKAHWTFKVFKQKVDPETGEPLKNADNYVSFQMNPMDNAANLSPEYLDTLEGLTERMKRRFLYGEFAEATPNALFDEADIDRWRADEAPESMVRIVVAVDPSGSDDDSQNENDEIGIVVAGLATDGKAYVLEDGTLQAGPATWGRMAVTAYQRHGADCLVAESNFGGAMVKQVILAAARDMGVKVNFKMVTASRGKVQRAEPFSALYEQGKVRHVGLLPKLEDELCAFSTTGYTGPRSPNRADAAIWSLAELFPAIVKPEAPARKPPPPQHASGGWLG